MHQKLALQLICEKKPVWLVNLLISVSCIGKFKSDEGVPHFYPIPISVPRSPMRTLGDSVASVTSIIHAFSLQRKKFTTLGYLSPIVLPGSSFFFTKL